MAHLFIGLVLIIAGLCGIVAWWNMFGLVMRGVVPFMLLVVGLIALLSAARRGSKREHVAPSNDATFDHEDDLDDDQLVGQDWERKRALRRRAQNGRSGSNKGTAGDLVSG